MRNIQIVSAAILGALAVAFAPLAQPPAMAQTKGDSNYAVYPLVFDGEKSLGDTGKWRDIYVWNLAYDQGYQAQCAYPKWKINPQTYGDLEEYFDLYNQDITFAADTVYNLDGSKMKIPLYRGKQANEDTYKISDFEGFFGALQTDDVESEEQPDPNNTGAAYHLLTAEGQCESKINNLEAIALLCDTLQEIDNCPLDTIVPESPIPKKLDILAKFNKLKRGNALTCADIASNWGEEIQRKGISESDFVGLQKAIQNTTLSLENLYRVAFLVLAPQQNPDDGGDDNFWFLSTPQKLNETRHAPLIIAFKIPEVATNKSLTLSAQTNYKDPAQLTAEALTSYENNLLRIETETKRRTDALADIDEKRGGGRFINCSGMAACGDEQQLTALTHAVVDIINGIGTSCESAPVEEVKYIFNSATAQFDVDTFSEKYLTKLPKDIDAENFSWQLTLSDEKRGADADIEVVSYLVLPLGANLREVEESLKGLWSVEAYEAMASNNKLADGTLGVPDYFPLVGDASNLEDSEDEFKFVNDPENTTCIHIGPIEIGGKCKTDTVGVRLQETKPKTDDLRILGAKLGWLIRMLQKNFNQTDNVAYQSADFCKTTDGLFSGSCEQQNKSAKSSSKDLGSCDEIRGSNVKVPKSLDEFKGMIKDAASKAGIAPSTMWAVFRTEGTSLLNAICSGASEVECQINDAGAVGPFQILTPMCAKEGHINKERDALKNRTKNYCDLEVALETAATELKAFQTGYGGTAEDAFEGYAYGVPGTCDGYTKEKILDGSLPYIQGCCASNPGQQSLDGSSDGTSACPDPMNYCECATYYSEGFETFQCGIVL